MKKCAICGKGVQHGNRVSFSHRLNKRIWKPNLQKVRIMKDGKKVRTHVCTKCLKTVERV